LKDARVTGLRRVLGNTSAMLISQAVTWTATVVLTAALGRQLGAAGFGEIYLAITFALIFGILVEFGLDQQLTRAVARQPGLAGPYLANALVIKLAMSVLAYALVYVVVGSLGYPAELRAIIAVVCLLLLPNGISTSLTAVYQGRENLVYPAAATALEKVLLAVLAIALLAIDAGPVLVGGAFVVSSAASVLFKLIFLRRLVKVEWRPQRVVMRSLIVGALPFLVTAILGAIYYRTDVVILSKLGSPEVVGWYAAAYRLFDTLVFMPSIVVGAVMLPIMSRLSVISRGELARVVRRGIDMMLILGVPTCVGLFMLAEPIVLAIYGRAEFLPTASALRWLAPGLLVLYVNSVLAATLVSIDRERRMTIISALAVPVSVGLNLMLIPQFQHTGAAAVKTAIEVMILGCLLLNVPRDVLGGASLRVLWKTAVASGAMCAVVFLLGSQHLGVLVLSGIGTYVVAGIALRLIPDDDLRALRGALVRQDPLVRAAEHEPVPPVNA